MNGFLSDQISPAAGVPQGFVLSPLLFLIYVSDLPKPHHRQNSKSQFADDTALWAASRNVHIAAKLLQKDLRKLAKWCAKWRIKLNPEKTKVIIFSRSYLAGKPEPTLKLYGERLKIYPHVKFLGITFDSTFTFKKHFEDILGRCNARYHRNQTFNQQKNGDPARPPSTNLQTMCPANFRIRLPFDHNNFGHKHQRNSTAPEQIYSACPAFTKYISLKLLHDSSGLPYVKDRLFSHATKTSERISANPLVEESISSNKVNPAWDRFPTPLSLIRPVSLKISMAYRANSSDHSSALM